MKALDKESNTKIQHYLPQFYSRFYIHHVGRKSIIGLYDVDDCLVHSAGKKDKKCIDDIVKKFGQEDYLYETDSSNPDNFVEKLFQSFENRVRKLFDRLYNCAQLYDSQHMLSANDIGLLFWFVNMTLIRQPDSVDHFKGNEKKYSFWNYKLFMMFAVNKTIPPFGYDVAYRVIIVHIDIANSKERFILGESGVVGRAEWLLPKFAFFPLTPTIGICLEAFSCDIPMIDDNIYQWTAPDKFVEYCNYLQRGGRYLKPIL